MKYLITIVVICLFSACGDSIRPNFVDSYIIETVVQLQPGKTKEVLELFKTSNPKLVSTEPDWIRASFSTLEDKDVVIVRAQWKDKNAYLKFSNSEKFKETMKQFSRYFASKPEVTITKVLFEM